MEEKTVWLTIDQMAELYGKTRSAQLFDLVKIEKKEGVDYPRKFEDYQVTIDKDKLPSGVTIEEMI